MLTVRQCYACDCWANVGSQTWLLDLKSSGALAVEVSSSAGCVARPMLSSRNPTVAKQIRDLRTEQDGHGEQLQEFEALQRRSAAVRLQEVVGKWRCGWKRSKR